jgi:hypothetical protein
MTIENVRANCLKPRVVVLICHAFGILTPFILNYYNPIMPSALLISNFLSTFDPNE